MPFQFPTTAPSPYEDEAPVARSAPLTPEQWFNLPPILRPVIDPAWDSELSKIQSNAPSPVDGKR